MRLFEELRRRRVLPVAGAYIAIAWLAVEISGFLLEQLAAPTSALRLLAITLVVGFPVAVALAWMVQRQPRGDWRLDSSRGQLRAVFATVVLGLVATAGLAWLILPRIEDVPTDPGYQPLPNSLAILPLATTGANPNERNVAATLYRALLEGLSGSRELTLVRLSIDEPPPDPIGLGRRVRATALLTGRVQSLPGGSRVEIELLDVAHEAIRWSKSITWDASRIMEQGNEIANGVLESMALPALPLDRFAGTDDREAYDAFLLGHRFQRSFNVRELTRAMDEFQRAIDGDPGFVQAYVGLAQTIFVYLNIQGPKEAERRVLTERQHELVDAAYRLDENNPDTLSLMGLLADNHELKVELLERALLLDPNNGRSYFRLGWARYQEGDFQEAERLFRRSLDFEPLEANFRSDLAFVLWDLGRYEEARAELERSIELDPRMTQNYQKLAAWNMFHYGRIDEAIINLRKAYALDPEVGYTAGGIATNYRHLGMKDEAFAWTDRALELSPTDSWIWVLAAYVHKSFEDQETAMGYYRRSLELAPGQMIPLRELGYWDIRHGRWEVAKARWAEAYPELVLPDDPVVEPNNIGPAVWYATNLERAGLTEQAARLVEKCREVVRDFPPDSDVAQTLAEWLKTAEKNEADPAQIIEDLRVAIVDRRQRAELPDFNDGQFDPVRDRPEFRELIRIVEDGLAAQRQHIRDMERRGQMPPAPGVVLPAD